MGSDKRSNRRRKQLRPLHEVAPRLLEQPDVREAFQRELQDPTGAPESEASPLPTLAELQRGDVLRLHMGELDPEELLIAQAAVRFCYSKLLPVVDPKLWVRLRRVQQRARELFGDDEKAETWLRTPAPFVAEHPPVAPYDLATTENGARLVMSLLLKTAHGVF